MYLAELPLDSKSEPAGQSKCEENLFCAHNIINLFGDILCAKYNVRIIEVEVGEVDAGIISWALLLILLLCCSPGPEKQFL